jgi:hypothetical protein
VAWTELDADGRTADVWARDLERGLDTRVSFDTASDYNPVWSPAGDRIAWTSYRSGGGDLYEDSAANPGNPRLLFGSAAEKQAAWWSAHAFLFVVEGKIRQLTRSPHHDQALVSAPNSQFDAALSSDERWLAYGSDESGRPEVYLQPFPPNGKRWQVSTAGGLRPRWRADGRELYFLDLDRGLEVAAIDATAASPPGVPHRLFVAASVSGYDVTPDGQRFLVHRPLENASVATVTVLSNWRRLTQAAQQP